MASKKNMKSILYKISKSPKVQKQVQKKINDKVQAFKRGVLDQFDSHPVTREISAGENAVNVSNSLGGYGNLFSFIGFASSSNPTLPLRQVIDASIKLKLWKTIPKGKRVQFKFLINTPSEDAIYSATPMPWESGSWVRGVEEGMSNFGFYMYKKFQSGRSGMGLQSDHELRKAIFSPQKYVSEILENFKEQVRMMKIK
tara:strand:- start:1132 stop:1728 length:597 start_codon:yes stop_codon:yes gene_type:complete